MPSRHHPVDRIVGHFSVAAYSIVDAMNDQLRQSIIDPGLRITWRISPAYLPIWQVIRGGVTLLRDMLHYANMASLITGLDWTVKQLPGSFRKTLFPNWLTTIDPETPQPETKVPPEIPPSPPSLINNGVPEELRLPIIERGAKRLLDTQVMTRRQFDAASDAFKLDAFTVGGNLQRDAITSVRQTLSDTLARGASLDRLSNELDDGIKANVLGDWHIETVYRTGAQSAFRDGRQSIVNNPIVQATFPYQEYVATHDGRVREEHLQLESLGLNGTGIYRLDDPFWDYFTPPWGFNCRCSTRLLTLAQAAKAGVQEAIRWSITGIPPDDPEHRLASIPFPPVNGFGSRGRSLVGVA